MLLDKTINFADLLLLLYDCIEHFGDEENKKKIDDFAKKIVVQDYCSMRDKQGSIIRILAGIEADTLASGLQRPDEIAVTVERLIVMEEIMLYTNIYLDNAIDLTIFTPELYDALFQSGIMEDIVLGCEEDEQVFRSMVNNSLNWSNIFNIAGAVEKVSGEKMDELINTIQEAKKDLNIESINKLHEIATITNPMRQTIGDVVSAGVVASLEKINTADLNANIQTNNMISNINTILSNETKNNITQNIKEYFKGAITDREINSVYEYLENKTQVKLNEVNIELDEENKKSLESGMTKEMIKLLSKKQDIENKYKKQEELISLADAVMNMDSKNIDEISNFVKQLQNK